MAGEFSSNEVRGEFEGLTIELESMSLPRVRTVSSAHEDAAAEGFNVIHTDLSAYRSPRFSRRASWAARSIALALV